MSRNVNCLSKYLDIIKAQSSTNTITKLHFAGSNANFKRLNMTAKLVTEPNGATLNLYDLLNK